MSNWALVLKESANEQTQSAIEELKDFIDEAKEDAQAVVKEHASRIESSLRLLTEDLITKAEFYGRIVDTQALLASAALVKGDSAKKAARKMAKEVSFKLFGAVLAVL